MTTETQSKQTLKATVEATQLDGEGTWLTIKLNDIGGLQSKLTLYNHRYGSFGEIVIKDIDKEFVHDLALKLCELYTTWEIHS